MFERIISLIGEENLNKIKNTNVLVVGVGGVGGFAIEALIRSGISHIILIDNDVIEASNLNRQVITNISNIGQNKVDVALERIKLILLEIKTAQLNPLEIDSSEKVI